MQRPSETHRDGYFTDMENKGMMHSEQQIPPTPAPQQEEVEFDWWSPGFFKQFPWLGIGSLMVILLCTAGSVGVLVASNGASQKDWGKTVTPNVLINITNSIANICFAIAIGNGVAIAWWRKTLKGATIEEIHRNWAFSTSLKDVLFSAKYFNVIALAALTAKLAIVDSTLMQKSTSTVLREDRPVQVGGISGFVNQSFPDSGRFANSGTYEPGLLSAQLSSTLKVWTQDPVYLPLMFAGCNGRCFVEVPAAGFEVDCRDPVAQFINYADNTHGDNIPENYTDAQRKLWQEPNLFSLKFDAHYATPSSGADDYSYIDMNILHTWAPDTFEDDGVTPTYSCNGTRITQTCRLRPAIISYPVELQKFEGLHQQKGMIVGRNDAQYRNASGATDGLYMRSSKQQTGFKVMSYVDIRESNTAEDASARPPGTELFSKLAGIHTALNMYLGGVSTLRYPTGEDGGSTGSGHFYNNQTGNAPLYLTNQPSERTCAYRYTDPLNPSNDSQITNVVQKINEIMFAYVTNVNTLGSVVNGATTNFTAVEYTDSIHYKSNWYFMAGAIASTALCVLLVLPSYYGFWQLGRKVTLGPLEIAHAFRSPMTAQAQTGTVEEVIKEVGSRQIQYGHIIAGDAAGVVGVAEPEYVAAIHSSTSSAKEEIRQRISGVVGSK